MKYQSIFPSIIIITIVFCFVISSVLFILKSSIKEKHSLITYAINYAHDYPRADLSPEDNTKPVVNITKGSQSFPRPYFGIHYFPINAEIVSANNPTVDYGAFVIGGTGKNTVTVVEGSPAYKAGIIKGDVILEADGVKLGDAADLASIIWEKKVGDVVNLKILRKSEKIVAVTLEAKQDNGK